MASKRILLLGGHGKISLLLTPRLVAHSWHVTSVIRDASQTDDILATVEGDRGSVDVLVSSLEDVKSKADAQQVIDRSKPDYVVWSAGMLPFALSRRKSAAQLTMLQAPAVKELLHARRLSTGIVASISFELRPIHPRSPSSC